jgi:hypothetical protein
MGGKFVNGVYKKSGGDSLVEELFGVTRDNNGNFIFPDPIEKQFNDYINNQLIPVIEKIVERQDKLETLLSEHIKKDGVI